MKNIKDMTDEERKAAMIDSDVKQRDRKLPLAERKKARKDHLELLLNPIKDFDPETFQPGLSQQDEDYEIRKRDRVEPPPRLPTLGMKPRQLMEGQMVGMYESKQDLYLVMAYYINSLLDRVDALEVEIRNIKSPK